MQIKGNQAAYQINSLYDDEGKKERKKGQHISE
jgi:hypothetical protein